MDYMVNTTWLFCFRSCEMYACFFFFSCWWDCVHFQAGKTALDKDRDNHHKDVALLLARAPQVSVCIMNLTLILFQAGSKKAVVLSLCRVQASYA